MQVWTVEHGLVFEQHWEYTDISGCKCGFQAKATDGGYGDSVVKHLMFVAWDQGYKDAVEDEAINYSHYIMDDVLVIDRIITSKNPYA
jgi:hypothetical protein